MRLKQLCFVICVTCLSVSCGSSDDVERADKKRAEVEDENKILKEENAALESLLLNVFMTETNVWAATKFLVDYALAESSCAAIGFTLPTSAQFAEFKKEIYEVNPNWQSISIDRYHQKDLTMQIEGGLALCRRDPNSASPVEVN
jgi:hypothetical protein